MTTRRLEELPAVMPGTADAAPAHALEFDQVYETHADFVWRSARRLGVVEDAVEDVVQEVFLTVHRRLAQFAGRSQLRTWIFGILLHVVRAHRRTHRRKGRFFHGEEVGPETLSLPAQEGPEALTERAQAARMLQRLLDGLEQEKREVFVLVELEGFSVAEAAEILGTNVNTTHGRLRAARKEFERLAARVRGAQGETEGADE
ncbi:MAG: sigma-70 family RNA polymerase sigma factor [Labilithrix sp.]|nr:sigma-70 family RNA polymerase sigma factor [Labilithrix sp.]MCW5811818.1 sigma-70 family RNA polymerase sigma factor [Labilithrix sp.]